MMGGTIGSVFAARATQWPDAPLLIDAETGEERSYRECLTIAHRWVAWFAAQGLAMGDRVAVILPNQLAYAELSLGAALAGITLCPYNPALTDSELADLVARYGAKVVLTAPNRQAALTAALSLPVVSLGEKGDLPAGLPEPVAKAPTVPPDALLVLVMTSGVSGGVKACRLSHNNLLWTSAQASIAFRMNPTSRYLMPLPLDHVNALVVGLLAAIQAGGAVAIGPRLPAAKLWEVAERCRATGMSTVPAIVHDLLADPGQPPESLRFAVCSLAPLSQEQQQAFQERFGMPLLVNYGLSEAGGFVTYSRFEPVSPPGSVGAPLGCEVRIDEGEVLVRGQGVFGGYDGDDGATRHVLRDGWLHTGDSGHLDENGFLYIDGRL